MIEVREKMVSRTPLTKDILDENDSHDGESKDTFGVEEVWEHGVFDVNSLSPRDWRKPIIEYLGNPVGGTDSKPNIGL